MLSAALARADFRFYYTLTCCYCCYLCCCRLLLWLVLRRLLQLWLPLLCLLPCRQTASCHLNGHRPCLPSKLYRHHVWTQILHGTDGAKK